VEATPSRSDILDTAKRLITGDRNKSYGSFAVQCEKLSQIWSAITGQTILPEHVGPILMGLKLVRMTTAGDTDSEVDIAGYAALHAEAFKGAKPDAPEKT
jgi:hypothetical protein